MAKRSTDPISGALPDSPSGATVAAPSGRDGSPTLTPERLAARIRRHRIDLDKTWPDYAAHLGLKLSTIYKIARGATRLPHERTLNKILKKLPVEGPTDEVVSGGQRYPERPED